MANAKKSGQAVRTKRKPVAHAAKNPPRPVNTNTSPVAAEVKYLAVAALGILLLLSIYVEGAAGFIGKFLRQLSVGLLGFGAYLLPFLVIVLSVWALHSKKRIPRHNFTKSVIFFWCLIALMHVLTVKETGQYDNVFAYFQGMYLQGGASNGGLMGALPGNLLRVLLGSAGAYTVLIAVGLISLLMLTGRSFMGVMGFFSDGFRWLKESFLASWPEGGDDDDDYDDDYEDYRDNRYDDGEILSPPKKMAKPPSGKTAKTPARESARTPIKQSVKHPVKSKADRPELLVIDERDEREPYKVLLINEELALNKPQHPIFKKRDAASSGNADSNRRKNAEPVNIRGFRAEPIEIIPRKTGETYGGESVALYETGGINGIDGFKGVDGDNVINEADGVYGTDGLDAAYSTENTYSMDSPSGVGYAETRVRKTADYPPDPPSYRNRAAGASAYASGGVVPKSRAYIAGADDSFTDGSFGLNLDDDDFPAFSEEETEDGVVPMPGPAVKGLVLPDEKGDMPQDGDIPFDYPFDEDEMEGYTPDALPFDEDISKGNSPPERSVMPFPVKKHTPDKPTASTTLAPDEPDASEVQAAAAAPLIKSATLARPSAPPGIPDKNVSPKTTPTLVNANPRYEDYQYPPISLLTKNQAVNTTSSRTQILENSRILEETLKSFRVEAKVVEVSVGPTVTRYDLAPGPGVKVATIANLSNDLALNLAAQGIRIEAPIPGKAAVGIEVPNKEPQPVLLREIIEDDAFTKFPSKLAFAVGKDIAGSPVVTDVARMPHLLIAGATGSGKSVCINTLITSLLYKSRPDEVKLLMIDPKVVELSVYNGVPHLLIPVVTDPKKASGALQWAVAEMENRYSLFAGAGVRELKSYNNYLAEEESDEFLPQIVIIIDELADLMMVCKGEVEESICRLAQKARAAGIHLIVATQRPSVDVITGLIKANIPSRLAFAVSSGIDSRTVLDMYGAEKLLGKGDMLFLPMGRNKPIRLQGGYISDEELEGIVDFLKEHTVTEYPQAMIEQVTSPGKAGAGDEDMDEFFYEAVEFLIEKGKASTSMLQRQFRIGYNRASRLMEDLESRGIVGPEDGVKPRKIMITREEFITNYGG